MNPLPIMQKVMERIGLEWPGLTYGIPRFENITTRDIAKLPTHELFQIIDDGHRTNEENARLFSIALSVYPFLLHFAEAVFGLTAPQVEYLRQHPPQPPKMYDVQRFVDAWKAVKEPMLLVEQAAREQGLANKRERVLEYLSSRGRVVVDEPSWSLAKLLFLANRIARDQAKAQYTRPIIAYNRKACAPRCSGWDGLSKTCNCGRTHLKWYVSPLHVFDDPAVFPLVVDKRTKRKEAVLE